MFAEEYIDDFKSKDEILKIISSDEFKGLFLEREINNVIIFGSLENGDFNDASDVDIAIISENRISFNEELLLTQELEDMLGRSIDLIDINDENINIHIKISALNSKFIVLSNEILEITMNYYDNLCKENEEFWRILDKEILGIE